jgi:hypothetical protein
MARPGLKILTIALMAGLLFPVWANGQTAPPDMKVIKAQQEQMRQQMEKMRQESEQRQEQALENLKKVNPQAYEKQKARQEQQSKISEILQSFRNQKIDAASAERQLYPLIKARVEGELVGIDIRISQVKKQLKELEQAKNNPDSLVKKSIDQLLGRLKLGGIGMAGAAVPTIKH